MKSAMKFTDRLLAAFAPAATAAAAPCLSCWYECRDNWTVRCCRDSCLGKTSCSRKWKGC